MNDQLELDVSTPKPRPLRPVTNADVAEVKSWGAAMKKAAGLSGMADKVLAGLLEIDAGQFSKTVTGQIGVMPDKLFAFMDMCGSEFPLMWLNYMRGYDIEAMRQRQTLLEREIADLRSQLERERSEKEIIKQFVRETRAA